jgi:hypothetical protein
MNTIMKAKAIILGSLVAVLAASGTPSLETLISQYIITSL